VRPWRTALGIALVRLAVLPLLNVVGRGRCPLNPS